MMSAGFNKGGLKFDGVEYKINTWYKIEEVNYIKRKIKIINQGVDNLLTNGVIYLSIRTDDYMETSATNASGIITLFPGDETYLEYDKIWFNIKSIWVQSDTQNVNIYWEYNEERD